MRTSDPLFFAVLFGSFKLICYICNIEIKDMKALIGKIIVGYRYGVAPESGKSYNYRDNHFEPGVSMAQIGYAKEVGSFAVSESVARKKYYYIGTICGEGSDDEICLSDVKRISYQEYLKLRKQYASTSNEYVEALITRKINLINKGYCLGCTAEQIIERYSKYIKK